MKSLRERTDAELFAEERRLQEVVALQQDVIEEIKKERAARVNGIRIGERVEYKGKTYQVADFEYGWPKLAAIKKDGTVSKTHKYAYNWKDWKAGKALSPFNSDVFL